jgi:hypothetical protein
MGKVTWQLVKERGHKLLQLLGLYLLVMMILVVVSLLGRLGASELFGIGVSFGMLTAIAGFLSLAVSQERVWVSNRWRLVPIANWKLYAASTLANVVATVLLWLLLGLIILALAMVKPVQIDWPIEAVPFALSFGCLFLVMLLLLGCLISLAHMLSLMITDFLPGMKEKWLKGLLTFGVVLVALKLVAWFFDGISWLFRVMGFSATAVDYSTGTALTAQISQVIIVDMWLAIAIFLVGSVCLSLVNCYLLRYWVETKQAQQTA